MGRLPGRFRTIQVCPRTCHSVGGNERQSFGTLLTAGGGQLGAIQAAAPSVRLEVTQVNVRDAGEKVGWRAFIPNQ
jgi:hypothetical protein